MDHDPDNKTGDDHPGERCDDTQPFPFIPAGIDKTLKRVFQLEEEGEQDAPPNPHRQEPDNKPS